MRLRMASMLAAGCLCALAGCGGNSHWNGGNSPDLTRHYKITDLGVLSQSSASKRVTRDPNGSPPGLIDLGNSALTGLVGMRPVRINAAGQVVGTIGSTASGQIGAPVQGYVYSGGNITPIGTLGGSDSAARAINSSGSIVGAAAISGTNELHAVLDSNGQMTDLGTLGGTFSVATAINSIGQITGYADVPTDSNNPMHIVPIHVFMYQGKLTDLGTLSGYSQSEPNDINGSGQIVGTATRLPGDTGSQNLAGFISSNGTLQDLGSLGGPWTNANAINNAGQVVGLSATGPLDGQNPTGQLHPYLWQNGKMTDLGTLGGNHGIALGINNVGQIVGGSTTVPNSFYDHAFLWQNGLMVDLNTLIPGSSGWLLYAATDINDSGQIVGMGDINGQIHGFLLTPQ
ncbi:MAG TPA: hypothetical protein VFA07_06740 [Chthonomonadaceae bacterium]|nr:hypothetical protein [Chthonomonadaceae bacterium]